MSSSKGADFITGDGRLVNVKNIADIYRDIYGLSVPRSGKIQRLDKSNYSLTCGFSATDCDVIEKVKTSKAYSLTTASKKDDSGKYIESVRCITDPHTLAEIAVATSENGRFLARLKSPSSGNKDDKKQLLEIWDRSKLLKTIDTSENEAHGLINTDPVFSSFHWSPFGEQDKLLYVCQKKQTKYQSFFKQTVVKLDEFDVDQNKEKGGGKTANFGDNYTRQGDWGECLKGVEHTLVAVLDVSKDCKITILDMEGFSLADARWLEGSKTISVAYPEEPRRLGLIYCNNRPSRLVVNDWAEASPKELMTLNSDNQCFISPRVSHSGRKFIYLAGPTFGPHKHATRLRLYDLDTNEDRELVDNQTKTADHFLMLEMNSNCFSTDDKHILFVHTESLHQRMCLFNLETSTLSRIKFPTAGIRLLDFRFDIILAIGSEVNATPTLFVSVLNLADQGELVAWHQIEDCLQLDEIEYKAYRIPTSDGSSHISAFSVTPTVDLLHKNFISDSIKLVAESAVSTELDLPTVVIVHGGPHSGFIIDYMPALVFYARVGLRTLLINYRGSTGINEEYLHTLCGNVGRVDVDDCLQAIRHLVQAKTINPNKLIIQGGSHGGFISCHLSCQDEFKFTSAVILNPVTDMTSVYQTSDIPDWALAEALGHKYYDHSSMPSSQDLVKLYECSPLFKHHQSKVPTLMLLGSQDNRVPMFQGERWFELLKARGVEAKCKVYPDKHDLAKVESESDRTMTAVVWILSHLQSSS